MGLHEGMSLPSMLGAPAKQHALVWVGGLDPDTNEAPWFVQQFPGKYHHHFAINHHRADALLPEVMRLIAGWLQEEGLHVTVACRQGANRQSKHDSFGNTQTDLSDSFPRRVEQTRNQRFEVFCRGKLLLMGHN
jgi:hypothetical protein